MMSAGETWANNQSVGAPDFVDSDDQHLERIDELPDAEEVPSNPDPDDVDCNYVFSVGERLVSAVPRGVGS